jgi:dnd system-associated protein 4
MTVHINNKYRIKRNANQQEMMQKLMSGNKLFDSYRDILMLSAAIGYANGAFVPIVKTASDGVLMQFFSEKDWDFMDLIAYAHKKEQNVLYTDEKYDIFSSYANGGFHILLKILEIEPNTDMDDTIQERKLLKLCELIVTGNILAPIEDEVFI